MKALVLKEYKHLCVEEAAVPPVGAGEVRIRVRACGICGSDIHGYDGSTGRRRPPVIMGHEAAGEIAEIGPEVAGYAIGDRVTFDSTISCGRCAFCRMGRINLCDNRRVLGVSCGEYRQDGAFAEFVTVPARILYRLPGAVSFEHAAMVEAISVAVHAVVRVSRPLGKSAVVVGAGMIGLLLIQAARAAGFGRIIAVDVDPDRLALAQTLGADDTILACKEDVAAGIRRMTDGRGAEVVFEVVGSADTLTTAVQSTSKGGTVVLVGNLSPQVPLPLQSVVTREISLLGSCASSGEYPLCLDLLASGAVRVDPLISAVAPLADGPAWFDRLYAREKGLMKVILVP
jgi:L-iditol 2-dehydrogenase